MNDDARTGTGTRYGHFALPEDSSDIVAWVRQHGQAHANIAEVAVVGVHDATKGQVPVAFAVVKDATKIADVNGRRAMELEVFDAVDKALGAIGRPARVHFVTLLPKTRSGKVLRRSIQAIVEGRDPGDLTTLDDPAGIEQIRAAVAKA